METEEIVTTETTETEFRICDEGGANWFLRKLANLEAEKARVLAQAAEIVRELESDAARLRYLYEEQLQEYVREALAARGGRKKTLRLLQGTCAFRTVPASVKVIDETVERFRGAAYAAYAKAVLEKGGELLPGTETVPERESFSIRYGKDGVTETAGE